MQTMNYLQSSFLAIVLILSLITGILFFILFLLFSQRKQQKKLTTLIEQLTAEAEHQSKAEPEEDKPDVQTNDERIKALETDNHELNEQLSALRKELERYEKTSTDAEALVRYFAGKQVSVSKEGIRCIVENGRLWLEEINALPIENEDNRISLYMLMNTLVDMAKMLMLHEDFLEDVFRQYTAFIQNPGGLRVRDNKHDEMMFLKNSLELSVLFRDYIRRHNEPEQFQAGKSLNINFEMIASGMSPSQIDAPQHNRRFDGSDIPSNLLVYSLICNMYGIDDLNVFISGDKIQKNIR